MTTEGAAKHHRDIVSILHIILRMCNGQMEKAVLYFVISDWTHEKKSSHLNPLPEAFESLLRLERVNQASPSNYETKAPDEMKVTVMKRTAFRVGTYPQWGHSQQGQNMDAICRSKDQEDISLARIGVS